MAFDPSSPESMFYEADRLIEAGKITEAASLLNELVEKFPEFGRAYNHLGYIFETKYRDYGKAEEFYRKCLQFSPDYPAIYLNFAILLSTQGRYEELEELLNRALDCPGINKAKVHNEFGIMYEIQAKYEEAIEAYKTAIRFSMVNKEIASYRNSIQRVHEKQDFLSGKKSDPEGGSGLIDPTNN